MPDILSCEHLVKIYDSPSGRVQAVRGVDLSVPEASVTAVVGPSGSGKSTLLRMLAGLDSPTAGHVRVDGIDLFAMRPGHLARTRARLITHIRQNPNDNLLAHLTAEQQIWRIATPRSTGRVHQVLDALDLSGRSHHTPGEMSGGERQRLAFARALAAGHRLIIADEPTSQLDAASAAATLDAVRVLARSGAAVLIATHDRRVLARVDEVVTLRDGALASVSSAGAELAVIDGAGRLQLPTQVLEQFPERRATVIWDPETGTMTVRRP